MKLKLALLLTLVAIGLHVYLGSHYYALQFGNVSSEAVCNVSAKFDCDTVAASSFSTLMGVPIALWGAATNIVLALLLIGWIIGWVTEYGVHESLTLLLSTFIALVSVIMGLISLTMMSTYCLFCIAVYFLSFIVFWLVWKSQSTERPSILQIIPQLFTKYRTYLVFFLLIPITALGSGKMIVQSYGAGQIAMVITESVNNWKSSPVVLPPGTVPSIEMGPADAKMTLSEFADFRCGHCRHAMPMIKAFVKANPDVRFQFYSFPLDGQCNPAVNFSSGLSCYLAKSVYCAEKVAQKGRPIHDAIFNAQEELNGKGTVEGLQDVVNKFLKTEGLDIAAIDQCVKSDETDAAIRAQAKAGADAKIRGTPAFFVNGKTLERAQLIPVLNAVKAATR